MIKNLVVITQRVKNKDIGLVQYTNYLLNNKAQSHKETEIIPLSDNSKSQININRYLVDIVHTAFEFDLNNKKGGRKVESYGQSFVFSLPVGSKKPTAEQWNAVKKEVIEQTVKKLGFDPLTSKEIAKNCFCVAHNQKNPHLNIVFPRIIKNSSGELIRLNKIDQKGFLQSAKNAFNASALKHLALDFKNYEPENVNTGKSLKSWQKRQAKADAAQEAAAKAQVEASETLQKAVEQGIKNEETLIAIQQREFNFNVFKSAFNGLIDAMKYYISNISKKSKEEDKKAIEENYITISESDFFEDTHQNIIENIAEIVDQEIEEEEEKITPVVKRRRKYKQ